MKKTNLLLAETLKGFAPISLDQLNATVALMERMETKYIIHGSELKSILQEIKDDFFVLTINGKSIFDYDNVYMDTKDYMFYYQHENKQDKRAKIRTRHYVDSSLGYFEFKQREWKVIRKFRYECGPDNTGKMTNESMSFYYGVYQSLYGDAPDHIIFPAVRNSYKRFTLCSKKNDERLTIDFDIELWDARNPEAKPVKLQNLVIIESKSNSNTCKSREILKSRGIEDASGCSKYCLGLYYHHLVNSRNTFKDAISTIEAIRKAKDRESYKTEKTLNKMTPIAMGASTTSASATHPTAPVSTPTDSSTDTWSQTA